MNHPSILPMTNHHSLTHNSVDTNNNNANKKRRAKRTEAERIEYFRNQPECGEIEPHRAFCTRCNKHVGLGKKQTYTVRPWETHRAKCDQKLPVSMM